MSVTMSCSLAVGSGHLILDYTVTNSGPTEIGLFNRLTGGSVRREFFSPNRLVIDWDARRLSLRKQVESVPPPLKAVLEVMPYLTRLAAGGQFRETIRLRLPVRVHNPYRQAIVEMTLRQKVEPERPVAASAADFSLGYFVNDGLVEFVPAGDDFPGIWRTVPIVPAIERQQLLTHSAEFADPVPVLNYPTMPSSRTKG